jgi:hypothetical protein
MPRFYLKQSSRHLTSAEARPSQRVASLDLTVERAWQKQTRDFRLVARLIERTIDKQGQALLLPNHQLEGWWTSLDEKPENGIERYCAHATHEQFHSEFKADLDLERLPSGKFDCNDLILQCALLAYNCLRLIGQLGLTGELSPVRHPAHRDGPAGNHVPRCAVHPQGAATDPGFRAALPGLQGLCQRPESAPGSGTIAVIPRFSCTNADGADGDRGWSGACLYTQICNLLIYKRCLNLPPVDKSKTYKDVCKGVGQGRARPSSGPSMSIGAKSGKRS